MSTSRNAVWIAAWGTALAALLTASDARAQRSAWPQTMFLGTSSEGGTFIAYGTAWAEIASKAIKVPIGVLPSRGSSENIMKLENQQVDLGMTTAAIARQAWAGEGEWTRGKRYRNFRVLFPMYGTPFQLVATNKSGIASVKQLQGKTVGVGPNAGTAGTYYPLILGELGIRAKIRYGAGDDMGSLLGEGTIDAFAYAAGLPVPAFKAIEAQVPVTFFTFTPNEMMRLQRSFPELSPAVIPAGTYRALKVDQTTLGVFNFAIGHKTMPEDLAYAIVKAVMENNAALVKAHQAARETVPENAGKNTFLPYHPGAARYFQEQGIKLPEQALGG